jgi:hypothetical protein
LSGPEHGYTLLGRRGLPGIGIGHGKPESGNSRLYSPPSHPPTRSSRVVVTLPPL